LAAALAIFFALTLCGQAPTQAPRSAQEIVQESARVTEADLRASTGYDYSETDVESDGSKKTYRVRMLSGAPYRELIAVNGTPVARDKAAEEKHKLEQETARRKESDADRNKRVQGFQKEQSRDLRFVREFVHAFDFKIVGQPLLDGRHTYLIEATPHAGFHPTDKESQVLTGMRGRMWIDQQTYQWVKVEADVVHPVSIEGFLAKVEPGTRFEVEKAPVEGDVWLAKHFAMTSKAKVLSVIGHKHQEDETYFDYRKSAESPK
jgi:hypothetical protein